MDARDRIERVGRTSITLTLKQEQMLLVEFEDHAQEATKDLEAKLKEAENKLNSEAVAYYDMERRCQEAEAKLKEAEQELLKDRCHHADMMSQAEIGYGIQIRNLESENHTLRKGMSESAVMFEARARDAESKMKDYEEAFLDSNAKRIHTREALNESKAWSKQLEESISRADARNEELLEGVKLLRRNLNDVYINGCEDGFSCDCQVGDGLCLEERLAEALTRTAKLVEGSK